MADKPLSIVDIIARNQRLAAGQTSQHFDPSRASEYYYQTPAGTQAYGGDMLPNSPSAPSFNTGVESYQTNPSQLLLWLDLMRRGYKPLPPGR